MDLVGVEYLELGELVEDLVVAVVVVLFVVDTEVVVMLEVDIGAAVMIEVLFEAQLAEQLVVVVVAMELVYHVVFQLMLLVQLDTHHNHILHLLVDKQFLLLQQQLV